jgi:hypothetical protein
MSDSSNLAAHPAVSGLGASIVRTIVPLLVGVITSSLLKAGVEIPEGFLDQYLAEIVFTLYYVGVRLLETYVGPAYGKLLGVAKKPTYAAGLPSHD